MGYFSEFRLNWPNLLGAGLGLAFGTAFNHYMSNLFGPALMAEFGWTKSQWSLVNALGLAGIVFTPIAGRIADRFGPRVAASIGFASLPISYVMLSQMGGNIYHLYAIMMFKLTFGIMTATMVFTRVVVERFDKARGVALACLLSCPPLAGTIGAPLIGWVIANHGWRTAYLIMAGLAALAGLATVYLIGRNLPPPEQRDKPAELGWKEFRMLCGNPIFPLLLAGMFLVNVPQVLVAGQMSIMLMESGASVAFATALVSVYGISVVTGRLIGGYALDRVPPHVVAIVFLGLPALGFVALASDFDSRWVLGGAIALVGLAQGAETDVAAMLTSRRFALGHYSFVFSLLMMGMGIASSLSAILLSVTLRNGGNFNLFLLVCAVATIAGALCFYLTGAIGARHDRLQGELA